MGLFKRRRLTAVERLMDAAGLPTAGGEIPVSDVAMDVLRRGSGRIGATLAAVENLLAGDDEDRRVAMVFLEDLRNAVSHGTDDVLGTGDVLPLRGPATVEAWDLVATFWSAVVTWCDETGVDLETAESLRTVEHRGLRSILWSAYLSLPDGRRVGVPEVLQYELATGIPMPVLGPHTAG